VAASPITSAKYANVAAADDGEVAAAWSEFTGNSVVVGPASGPFGAPTPVPRASSSGFMNAADVAMAPDGTTVIAQQDSAGGLNAAFRRPGGAFAAPETIATTVGGGFNNVIAAPVGIDDDGDAAVAFSAQTDAVGVSLRDGAGPQLRSLSVPDAAVAGQAASFSVAPVDVASAVASTTWDFGDGTPAASGPSAAHAYAAPGTYDVTVTASDTLGQPTTATRRVAVAAAPSTPAPAAPPAAAPPIAAPKPLAKLKSATVIKLTAPATSCSSRRTLTLRFAAPKGTKITKAVVKLGGKSTTYKGKKVKPKIDLRGLPKGKFTVKVTITLADGRTATLSKAYKTCVKKKKAKAKR
jgi:PKD repeat protein